MDNPGGKIQEWHPYRHAGSSQKQRRVFFDFCVVSAERPASGGVSTNRRTQWTLAATMAKAVALARRGGNSAGAIDTPSILIKNFDESSGIALPLGGKKRPTAAVAVRPAAAVRPRGLSPRRGRNDALNKHRANRLTKPVHQDSPTERGMPGEKQSPLEDLCAGWAAAMASRHDMALAGGGDYALSLAGMIFRPRSIIGAITGGRQDRRDVVALARSGKLAPAPLTRMPKDEANGALELLKSGKIVGRIVPESLAASAAANS